jgi:hypothetical protein
VKPKERREGRERELERDYPREIEPLLLLLIFFYLSTAGQTEREREIRELREIWERI